MDKRLMKRHKRQVQRKAERLRTSEPDIRTPDQLRAAREAGRPLGMRGNTAPVYASPSHAPVSSPKAEDA